MNAEPLSPAQSNTEQIDELERAVAMMARVGFCRSPSFSPDGKRIAFICDLSGLPQVWIVGAEGGWPAPVTALDDQILQVSWSPDGSTLAFALAPGGGMNQQIYLVHPDGTGLRRLTDGAKENNWLGPWSHDGRSLAFASNRRRAEAMDAYLVDVATGEPRLVAENDGIGSLADISHDGRRAILYRMRNRGDDNLFLLDLDTQGEALLTPHEGPGSFADGRFSPDGRYVYLVSNKDRDLAALGRVSIDDQGQPSAIEVIAARDDAELQGFELAEDGATAALIWNVAGRSEIAFLDFASMRQVPGPELPAELVAGITFSKDGRLLAINASGAASPWDIWVYDRATQELTQVTHSPHPGVALETLQRPELVRFPAHDGLELSGWLYRPQGSQGQGPVVLDFHGGPEGQARPRFDGTYQALLAEGIAVFAPNVRGSSGFGKRFVNLDNGALRFDAVKDIKACVDYVVGSGVADPRRIGIMGGSYGGYMVMAGVTEYPELLAAGANLFGIVNFETFFAETEPWMAAISKVEYGDPETEVELLRSLSPIHKIDRITAPIIVLHGANDTNVPVVEAEQVVDSLKRRGIPVEYVLFPDEGHGFTKTPNRIRSTVSIVRWFRRHLKASSA
jgi:dipeptidyl aminopeptidase/acylaminoacyl peptidase